MQALSCLDVQGEKALDLVRHFIDDSNEEEDTLAAAHKLLEETRAQLADCDRVMTRHAKHWDLSRLALVDRNILRLAVSELRTGQVPPKVVINEAIRMAKEFSTAESPRFINGVLDAVLKEMVQDLGKENI
jgi:N utilization substance protein B